MKLGNKTLIGILALTLVAGVFGWVAWAQILPASQPSFTGSFPAAIESACPVASTTVHADVGMNTCLSLAGTAVYMDSPAVLLAKAETIGLSEAQKTALHGIINQARRDALAVLTPEQKTGLGQISAEPVVIGTILPQSQTSECPMAASTALSGTDCGACPAATAASACCSADTAQ